MIVNKKLSNIISDFLINLSAGWIGSIFIVPAFSGTSLSVNLPILTTDLIMGIVSLFLAYRMRK